MFGLGATVEFLDYLKHETHDKEAAVTLSFAQKSEAK